ncbi:MAG: choice-of-anchor D domain-containing protein [Deltaproteobacteria bacterium]|nr:choice-of-anchor D domain-containing protein [Deltaproteobacteria bacterium]
MRIRGLLSTCLVAGLAACGGGKNNFTDASTIDASGIDAAANEPAAELPTSFTLGPLGCGTTQTQTFPIQNTGTADLSYTIASSNAAITVSPDSGTIIAGTQTTFTLTATAAASSAVGAAIASDLTITTNIPGKASTTVPVTATASGAVVEVASVAVGFGDAEVGTTLQRTVTFHNAGDQPFTIATAALAAPFGLTFTGAPGPASVPANSDLVMTGSFAPEALGDASATTALTIGGTICGEFPDALVLSGSGVPVGSVLVQGVPVDFGTVACGEAEGTADITLVNRSGAAATFTAAMLTDPQGDDAQYTVTPASGSIAASASATVTVTRKAIALPATPRSYAAVLRIHTVGQSAVDHDVAIGQTLDGPVLVVDSTARDFGWRPAGSTATLSIGVTNAGSAAAAITVGGLTAGLSSVLPMPIAADSFGQVGIAFTPGTDGATLATSAIVSATGACSVATSVPLAAGNGPYLQLSVGGEFSATCGNNNFFKRGDRGERPPTRAGGVALGVSGLYQPVSVTNLGNQDGTLSNCQEVASSELSPTLLGLPLTVPAGSGAQIDAYVAYGHSGTLTSTIRCDANEPAEPTKDMDFTRSLDGADLTLAIGPGGGSNLDFHCSDGSTGPTNILITNTGNGSAYVIPQYNLPYPVQSNYASQGLAPGSSFATNGVYLGNGGSGSNGACDQAANPGELLGTGSVGIYTGSGGICTVTPQSLPVQLFK